jgi:uncharacterized protein
MKPRINVLTLGVDDLARSLAFYGDGLNVPKDLIAQADDHFAIHLHKDLSLVFFERTAIAAITGRPHGTSDQAEHIIGHAAASREEVDEILRSAKAAGGTVIGSPKEEPWGYMGHFLDPDGHLWEVWWNPASNVI